MGGAAGGGDRMDPPIKPEGDAEDGKAVPNLHCRNKNLYRIMYGL